MTPEKFTARRVGGGVGGLLLAVIFAAETVKKLVLRAITAGTVSHKVVLMFKSEVNKQRHKKK